MATKRRKATRVRSRRKRKVAGTADYIIPLAVVGVGIFVLYKMGIFNGTFTGTGGNNQKSTLNTGQVADTAFLQSAKTVPQSLPDTTINTMINTMWQDYLSGTSIFAGTSYSDDIVNQMSNLDNITDLYRMYDLFGTRAMPASGVNLCNTLDIDCNQVDLGTFLKLALSSDQLSTVNQDLQGNGINYTFT